MIDDNIVGSELFCDVIKNYWKKVNILPITSQIFVKKEIHSLSFER